METKDAAEPRTLAVPTPRGSFVPQPLVHREHHSVPSDVRQRREWAVEALVQLVYEDGDTDALHILAVTTGRTYEQVVGHVEALIALSGEVAEAGEIGHTPRYWAARDEYQSALHIVAHTSDSPVRVAS